MTTQTPVSKTKRATLFAPYKEEVGSVSTSIQYGSNPPSVYVYHTEDKKLEVMNPMAVEVQHWGSNTGFTGSSTEYEYPVARFLQEEDIQVCSTISTFLKNARKNKPHHSVLLVSVGGILVSTILVQQKKKVSKKKVSRGFA